MPPEHVAPVISSGNDWVILAGMFMTTITTIFTAWISHRQGADAVNGTVSHLIDKLPEPRQPDAKTRLTDTIS